MSVPLKIDFDDLYDLKQIAPNKTLSSFESTQQNGNKVPLFVKISAKPHELMPNVYNLSFGPLTAKGRIDDKAELTHSNYSRVFSTILFFASAYLKEHPGNYLGIDGSDNARAYFYYRALQRNFNYLDERFRMFGIKYYIRISRFGKTQYENPYDFEDIIAYPSRITKGALVSQDQMYNYFIFNRK